MASGLLAPRSARPGTSNGPGMKNLPVIQHPRAKMGDNTGLAVRGESRQGLTSRLGGSVISLGGMGRANTFVSLDRGNLETGLDRSNLPPLTERMGVCSASERIVRFGSKCNPGGNSYMYSLQCVNYMCISPSHLLQCSQLTI